VAWMNESGGHRKVLVSVALARARFKGCDRHSSDALACTRPFQVPPRPRAYA
jgi:hypothetical protein